MGVLRVPKTAVALVVAVALVIGGASSAVADQIAVGDGIDTSWSPLDQPQVRPCTDTATKFNIGIYARRTGNSSDQTFKNGSDVAVSFDALTSTSGVIVTLADSTIGVDSDWTAGAPNDLSEPIIGVVTIPAQAAAGSVALNFTFTSTASSNKSYPGQLSTPAVLSWTASDLRTCGTTPPPVDTTPPTVTVPGATTVEATGPNGAVVTFVVTAIDETAPTSRTVTCAPASGSTFALGVTQVSCSATDAAGNTGSASFAVTVVDTTAPSLTLPDDFEVEATGSTGAVVEFEAAASDRVDGDVEVTCLPPSGSTFVLGSTEVTCSAEDTRGYEASGSFDVTVVDTTAPSLTLPDDFEVEATGSTGAVVEFEAAASDLVDGDVEVTCLPPSGSTFVLGSTEVTCSAEDTRGYEASGSFDVTVVDTTAPEITVPDDFSREATGPGGAVVSFEASAVDLVDGAVDVACGPASGSEFALGSTEVTCSATDAAGNFSPPATFTVTVVDTTAPEITVPDDFSREATGPDGAVVSFEASAVDLVDGAVDVACHPASGSEFALGSTEVECSAADAAGNRTQVATFTVTVVDTTAPEITVPSPMTAEATGPTGATVSFTATASDLVDGSVSVTCTPASGSTFALGVTPVTCSAEDSSNNSGTASFTVTVRDTTAPTIQWVGGPAGGSAHVFGSVPAAPTCVATDAVDPAATCVVSGYSAGVGSHTLTARAADATGNPVNVRMETRSYVVTAWSVTDFATPVDKGIHNTVKAGATVPLKFEVFAGATELIDTAAVKYFSAAKKLCVSGAEDGLAGSTGNTALRYDATGGQFIQNWKTPSTPGACYTVTIETQDGTKISADFKLK